MDAEFRRILRPVDGRGKRGVYSRGKPNYPGLLNAPNPTTLQELAKKRLEKRGMRSGYVPNSAKRPS